MPDECTYVRTNVWLQTSLCSSVFPTAAEYILKYVQTAGTVIMYAYVSVLYAVSEEVRRLRTSVHRTDSSRTEMGFGNKTHQQIRKQG